MTGTAGREMIVELPAQTRRARMTGMHFETDKAFLLPVEFRRIRMLCNFYKSFPDRPILVTGHTDLQGSHSPERNRGLSEERAEVVKAFLLDDVATWMRWYRGRPASATWGVREDQHMLHALTAEDGRPFYDGPIDGIAGPMTRAALKAFQASQMIDQTGTATEETREALCRAYMAQPDTSLRGASIESHGCGQWHPLPRTTGAGAPDDQPRNRRVEVFVFDRELEPPPRSPCPAGGCLEYQQWVEQTVEEIDLDIEPADLKVVVVGQDGQPLSGAHVRASGPFVLDGTAADDGAILFTEILPGRYSVVADVAGLGAQGVTVDVPPASPEKRPTEARLQLAPWRFVFSV